MKTMNRFRNLILGYLILNGLLVLVTLSAWAATNHPALPGENITFGTPAPPSTVHVLPNTDAAGPPTSNLSLFIALVVPALISGIKSWMPKLPSWTLPILAPALGALADWVMQLSGTPTNGVAVGALLGSAGVGLREFQDQLKQKIGPASNPPAAGPVLPPSPAPTPVTPPAPVAEPPKTT